MRLPEIQSIARGKGLRPGKMKKIDLIRAIQNEERNRPCFATGMLDRCGQGECLWREDCQ